MRLTDEVRVHGGACRGSAFKGMCLEKYLEGIPVCNPKTEPCCAWKNRGLPGLDTFKVQLSVFDVSKAEPKTVAYFRVVLFLWGLRTLVCRRSGLQLAAGLEQIWVAAASVKINVTDSPLSLPSWVHLIALRAPTLPTQKYTREIQLRHTIEEYSWEMQLRNTFAMESSHHSSSTDCTSRPNNTLQANSMQCRPTQCSGAECSREWRSEELAGSGFWLL